VTPRWKQVQTQGIKPTGIAGETVKKEAKRNHTMYVGGEKKDNPKKGERTGALWGRGGQRTNWGKTRANAKGNIEEGVWGFSRKGKEGEKAGEANISKDAKSFAGVQPEGGEWKKDLGNDFCG